MFRGIEGAFAVLANFALLSCSSIEFEQTTERGSLMEYEEARIPESYRGLWASPKDACIVTRDYGMQIEIGERSFGDVAVRRLWFYSDYPDIVVKLDCPKARPTRPLRCSCNCRSTNRRYACGKAVTAKSASSSAAR